MEWKGCYIRYKKERLSVGNEMFERSFRLDSTGLYAHSLTDKKNGYIWQNEKISGACLYGAGAVPRIETEKLPEGDGLRTRIIFDRREGEPEELAISVRGGLPFFSLRLPGAGRELLEEISLRKGHFRVRAVRLFDQTDGRDTLVACDSRLLWTGGKTRMDGTLFFVEDYLENAAFMMFRELPSYRAGRGDYICADKDRVRLMGQVGCDSNDGAAGYDVTVGVGSLGELSKFYKLYYRRQRGEAAKRETFCMSNTWGDRNRDAALNEDFVRREIERAAELGVDVLQLDDGWQQGATANSALKTGGAWDGGYYSADGDFWRVHQEKFPNGLAPLSEFAADLGITLGLWFSPDSEDDFANWRRDADVMVSLYENYKIKYFKLDGIRLENQKTEERYARLLDDVRERTGGEVAFNLDITAGRRTGYFWHKEHGTLFVENRYTDWGNYWPHNTLKNLWQLSRYIPTERLQIEVLNNRRNAKVYGDDPLAPAAYPIDYLFASAMVANPLLWMELTGLADEDVSALRDIIAVYKKYRGEFSSALVSPIGEQPDGTSLTGFKIELSRGEGFLLVFREYTDRSEIILDLENEFESAPRAELIYGGCEDLSLAFTADGKAAAHIGEKRSYALWRYHDGRE